MQLVITNDDQPIYGAVRTKREHQRYCAFKAAKKAAIRKNLNMSIHQDRAIAGLLSKEGIVLKRIDRVLTIILIQRNLLHACGVPQGKINKVFKKHMKNIKGAGYATSV